MSRYRIEVLKDNQTEWRPSSSTDVADTHNLVELREHLARIAARYLIKTCATATEDSVKKVRVNSKFRSNHFEVSLRKNTLYIARIHGNDTDATFFIDHANWRIVKSVETVSWEPLT